MDLTGVWYAVVIGTTFIHRLVMGAVMAKLAGLDGLYVTYGENPFRGTGARDCMIRYCDYEGPRAGWSAAIALGYLENAGMVACVDRKDGVKWNSTWKLTRLGVETARRKLGMDDRPGVKESTVERPEELPPPGSHAFINGLKRAEGRPVIVRGQDWRKWAWVDWAKSRGLIEIESVARVTLTDEGREWDGQVLKPIMGAEMTGRAGAKITARLYQFLKEHDRDIVREGASIEELAGYWQLGNDSVARQLRSAFDNGYVRNGAAGWQVVLGDE